MKTAYDFIYQGMSAHDRANMEADLTNLVLTSCAGARAELLKGVEQSVTLMYEKLSLNPMWFLVEGNCSHSYELVDAIREQLIKELCSNAPPENIKSRILSAWISTFPEELKAIADKALLDRIDHLEAQVRSCTY